MVSRRSVGVFIGCWLGLAVLGGGDSLVLGASPSTPVVIDLGDLGGGESIVAAMNERGAVVGWSRTRAGEWHAFVWQAGRMRDLGTLGGHESYAVAVNGAGDIVGQAQTADGRARAFLWHAGRMRSLGTLPGSESSRAYAINDRGDVVGAASTLHVQHEPKFPDEIGGRAFLWRRGQMADLNSLTRAPGAGTLEQAKGVNSRGQIVGSASKRDRDYAFLWERGAVRDLGKDVEPDAATSGEHINDRGQVAVEVWVQNASYSAVWSHGVAKRVAEGGHRYVGVNSLASDGLLAGDAWGKDPSTGKAYGFGFVGRAGHVVDLTRVRRRGSKMQLGVASGVDRLGNVAGYGLDGDRARAFLLRGLRR